MAIDLAKNGPVFLLMQKGILLFVVWIVSLLNHWEYYTHTLEQLYLIKCQQFVPSNHKRKDSLNPCANCNYPSQLPFKAIVK